MGKEGDAALSSPLLTPNSREPRVRPPVSSPCVGSNERSVGVQGEIIAEPLPTRARRALDLPVCCFSSVGAQACDAGYVKRDLTLAMGRISERAASNAAG